MHIKASAEELGEIEVGWWKAHNEGNKKELLALLLRQHKLIYSASKLEVLSAIKHLVKATQYHDRKDWNLAEKEAATYYSKIKPRSGLNFNPQKAAKLEVGWWKLHDDLEHEEDKSPLAKNFAQLYAEIFGLKEKSMEQAGKHKAEATRHHDLAEKPGISQKEAEGHWNKAEKFLIAFYREVKKELAN